MCVVTTHYNLCVLCGNFMNQLVLCGGRGLASPRLFHLFILLTCQCVPGHPVATLALVYGSCSFNRNKMRLNECGGVRVISVLTYVMT